MSNPRVLIGVTIYEGKEYCWDLFYKNLQELTYDNYEVVIADNSRKRKYFHTLQKRTKDNDKVRIIHTPRYHNTRQAQSEGMNRLTKIFLDEGFDYFFSLEADLVPPVDIIQRLLKHKVDVVGSIYVIGFEWSKKQPPRPCLFSKRIGKDGRPETYNLDPNTGFSFFGHGLVQIHGCGIGCSLIKRHILEKFTWKYDLRPPIKHTDVLFYMELDNAGYPVYVDTDCMIPHHNSDWRDVKDI